MKTFLLLFLLFPVMVFSQSGYFETTLQPTETDTLYKPYYPDGVYETMESFLNKRPRNAEVVPKTVRGKNVLTTIRQTCLFSYKSEKKAITKAFAISYHGHLYFQLSAIMDYANKKDRNQNNYFGHIFVKALMGGYNYIYTEAEFADEWEQALAFNAGGQAGGFDRAVSLQRNKGIVWDFWKHEFNIFRKCKDFNDFVAAKYPEEIRECSERLLPLEEVRKTIDKIK